MKKNKWYEVTVFLETPLPNKDKVFNAVESALENNVVHQNILLQVLTKGEAVRRNKMLERLIKREKEKTS